MTTLSLEKTLAHLSLNKILFNLLQMISLICFLNREWAYPLLNGYLLIGAYTIYFLLETLGMVKSRPYQRSIYILIAGIISVSGRFAVYANHAYLLIYFAILSVLYKGKCTRDYLKSLSIITGLVYFFSIIHKILSPEFLNGFYLKFLYTHERFFHLFNLIIRISIDSFSIDTTFQALSYCIVFIQFIIAVFYIRNVDNFLRFLLHFGFLIISLFVLDEYLFYSIAAISAALCTQNSQYKNAYIFFFFTSIACDIGN